jgi:hypothetical protein
MRKVIANSIEQKRFNPKDKAQWAAAYELFLAVLGKKRKEKPK